MDALIFLYLCAEYSKMWEGVRDRRIRNEFRSNDGKEENRNHERERKKNQFGKEMKALEQELRRRNKYCTCNCENQHIVCAERSWPTPGLLYNFMNILFFIF